MCVCVCVCVCVCHEVDLKNIPPIVWPLINTQMPVFQLEQVSIA